MGLPTPRLSEAQAQEKILAVGRRIWPWLEGLAVISVGAASGCAGPTTPLGAVWDMRPQWSSEAVVTGVSAEDLASESPAEPPSAWRGLAKMVGVYSDRTPRIRFVPPRQWLHSAHSLKVIIEDPSGVPTELKDSGLTIRYHGHDVTRSFLMQAKVTRKADSTQVIVEVPTVRLSAMNEHLIEVSYTNTETGGSAGTRLNSPICRAFAQRSIQNLDEFRPERTLTQAIDTISKDMGFNPAFTAALIAQESAFNPRSVSLAKALGLTQVTALAELEVTGAHPEWPRYPGINDIPAALIKWQVLTGEINADNEWRLSPTRSIQGGLTFARRLADRWRDNGEFSKVNWQGGNGDIAGTKLILASYNSGYTRVLQAVHRHGAAWLLAPELKEARNYVNRIFSYCDAFERTDDEEAKPLPSAAVQKVFHENET